MELGRKGNINTYYQDLLFVSCYRIGHRAVLWFIPITSFHTTLCGCLIWFPEKQWKNLKFAITQLDVARGGGGENWAHNTSIIIAIQPWSSSCLELAIEVRAFLLTQYIYVKNNASKLCLFLGGGGFPPRSSSNLVLIIVLSCDKTTAIMEKLRKTCTNTWSKYRQAESFLGKQRH